MLRKIIISLFTVSFFLFFLLPLEFYFLVKFVLPDRVNFKIWIINTADYRQDMLVLDELSFFVGWLLLPQIAFLFLAIIVLGTILYCYNKRNE